MTAAVAAVGVGGAAWAAVKSDAKPSAAKFAGISALIFAAQMMNFPIRDGTSGHLIGGVLASAVLGTPFGILAISLVLAVQCLLFSDGGLTVLGANVVNMALVGAGIGGWIAGRLREGSGLSMTRLAFASWLSVVLAALACSLELALSGVVPFSLSAPPMLQTHAVIGAGEACVTIVAFLLLRASAGDPTRTSYVPGLAAVLVALVLSPFASSYPDGLEWVAAQLGFLHESGPVFVAPLAEYSVPGVLPAALSTGLSGLAGVLVVFALGWTVSLVWRKSGLHAAVRN